MTRRTKIWRVLAALFVLVNVAGAVMAGVAGEALHTGAHVGLTFLGAYLVWRLGSRAQRQDLASSDLSISDPTEERLERLQQSMDAIGLEVERIGEAQRYSAKLETERTDTQR